MNHVIKTACGILRGNERSECYEYLGVPYATAARFEYPTIVKSWDGEYDASVPGAACPQLRSYNEHLEVPERLFYHNEYRRGQVYNYNENCLNMNIYTPKNAHNAPVVVFIHGGGFNSGCNCESAFDGEIFAKNGVILCVINYRVGILGYLTHSEISNSFGHDGNFGLYDQLTAVQWVKDNISSFGGDSENITLMGQSAGAISIQYLCLSEKCRGLFKRAVMMSGGGKFPDFALPRRDENTRDYWLGFMEYAGLESFEALKNLDCDRLFTSLDGYVHTRKDNTYNTMPVVDGALIADDVKKLIRNPLKLDYIIGFTNNDMYAPLMALIGSRFARQNKGYVYYFDIDAPGDDNNGAFHSCDLRYMFGTLSKSHRHYTEHDYEVSGLLNAYICNFARTGDPNAVGLPMWEKYRGKALCFTPRKVKMGHPDYVKMTCNMLTKGEPK